jgi:hypothetical protein
MTTVHVIPQAPIVPCHRPRHYIAREFAPSSSAVRLAAVVGYLASRTASLPQIGEDVGNWTEPLGVPAVASETLRVVPACVHLRRAA